MATTLTNFFKPVAGSSDKKAEGTPAAADSHADGDSAAAAAAAPTAKATAASRKRKSAAPASPAPAAPAAAAANNGVEAASAAAAAVKSATKAADAANEAAATAADGDEPAAKRAKADSLASLVPASWARVLSSELDKPYFGEIDKFLRAQATAKVQVFPAREHIFRALDLCPFDKVRVVILGQDPYHDVGQAEGLSFSVPAGVKVPSSLQNIYKELASDLGAKNFTKPKHGHLAKWAEQGVLLLNTGLTVKAHEAGSHKKVGWHRFTEAIVKAINKDLKGVVFILWGKHAQDAAKGVDESKHYTLKSAHPSGLSASRGFFGCKHFSKTNELLTKQGKAPIDWQV